MTKAMIALPAGIGLLVATLASGGALASDLLAVEGPVEPALSYAQTDYWTGFYAGVYGAQGIVDTVAAYNGGVQFGYNHRFDNFVLGAEIEGTYNNAQDYLLPGGGVLRQNWSGAASLRAGIAFDRVLLYGTAGVGAAYLESEGTVTSPDKWVYGLTFGGGVEVAFTDAVSAKLEYTQALYTGVESTIGGVTRTDDLTNHAIKAGLNFHF